MTRIRWIVLAAMAAMLSPAPAVQAYDYDPVDCDYSWYLPTSCYNAQTKQYEDSADCYCVHCSEISDIGKTECTGIKEHDVCGFVVSTNPLVVKYEAIDRCLGKSRCACSTYFQSIEWEPGVYLGVGDEVVYNDTLYLTVQAHTTQAGWHPPAVPALFELPPPYPGSMPEWEQGTAYSVGQRVTYNGNTYRCQIGHTAYAGWTPAAVPALWIKE